MPLFATRGVGGIMVSIAAFQAVDPGSIPGRRNFDFFIFVIRRCHLRWNMQIFFSYNLAVIAQLGER